MADSPGSRRKGAIPSSKRLLASETRLLPARSKVGAPVALGYPNSYAVGMSNLGFHQVYRLLHERADVQVQRFFCPPGGGMRGSFEEGEPLGGFRMLAFSLPYEADYARVVKCLRGSGIRLRREERSQRDPLVILGGIAVSANPRPLGPLADAVVLGECEQALPRLLDTVVPSLYEERKRERVWERLGELPGVYVPGVREDAEIQRVPEALLDSFPAHSVFLPPHTVFGSTLLVELGRGCRRGCAFCLTGHLLHGCRNRSAGSILQQAEEWGDGAGKVGLISPEVSSHPEIEEIVERLIGGGKQVTFSSMETDRITPRLVSLLARAGLRTLTLAPEAGSDAIRKRLRKPYSNEQILETVSLAAATTIRKIKLYYLVGVPETGGEETEAIAGLTSAIAERFRAGSAGGGTREIGVTLSPLVPKPFTPLAGAPMAAAGELRRRLRKARTELSRTPGVSVSVSSVGEAMLEYTIGMGDESVFELLTAGN